MTTQFINFRISDAQAWVRQAACADEGAPSMFPHEMDEEGTKSAKAVCRACPVVEECLSDAMRRSEPFGIWGGLTTNERRGIRNRSTRAARKESARD